MLVSLYRTVTHLGGPLIANHLRRRARRGKEDGERLDERFGKASRNRPDGPLIWFHAASVGEALAILPLLQVLLDQRGDLWVLVTTGTVTSAKLMANRLPKRAIHQFAPIDRGVAWRRFLDHWRPDAGCLVESEVWPNLIVQAERQALPLAIVNGRLSKRSFDRWQTFESTASRLFSSFELCLARNGDDGERFQRLGARDVRSPGDLKRAAAALPVDDDDLKSWQARLRGRPVWLGASTHPGEEELILQVHQELASDFPDLLTMIVPRHPERGNGLTGQIKEAGFKVGQRSKAELPDETTDIYLGDSLGELGLFYRLAPIVLIGGSLVPKGGQNPLEAARLDCALIVGPYTQNFEEMTRHLIDQGAAVRVGGNDGVSAALRCLFNDEQASAQMIAAARQVARAEQDVLDRILAELMPWLDRKVAISHPGRSSCVAKTADACP